MMDWTGIITFIIIMIAVVSAAHTERKDLRPLATYW